MAKVLLVEDDNNLREIYEMSLKAEGYETLAATNGEEALDVAAKNKPDLIISDVMMPKVSGFEMLAKLREDPALKDTPVIMMTALSQSEDKVKADRLGVKKYLVKSQVTLEDLAKVAKELVPPTGEAPAVGVSPQPPADAPTEAVTPAVPVAEPVITAQPEPSAAQPAVTPEPAAQPTAPSQPPAPMTPSATTSAATPEQQTSDQEQAAIEAQINAFIDSASTEATAKTVEATNAPMPAVTPEPVAPPTSTAPNPEPVVSAAPETATSKKTIQPLNNPAQGPDLNQLVAAEEQKENEQKAAAPLPTGSVITVENPTTDAFNPPADPQINVTTSAPNPVMPPTGQVVNPQSPPATPTAGEDGKPKIDPNAVAL